MATKLTRLGLLGLVLALGLALAAVAVAALPERAPAAAPVAGPQGLALLKINEIDYDQVGTDTAEFIELYNTSTYTGYMEFYSLELVNGNGGGAVLYRTITFPVGLEIGPLGYFVICANAATVPNCDYDVAPDTDHIQNGSPDAVGLRDDSGFLLDTVSYEGNTGAPYTENTGTTAADSNTVASVGLSRFPDGADTNNNNADFALRCITPGEANTSATTGCVASSTSTPTSTSTATATSTSTATATNTATALPTATNTATALPTATNTATALPTATNTATALPTATNTATALPTATNTATALPTATNTATALPTGTSTATAVATGTSTATAVATGTSTATAVATGTSTATAQATNTATAVATGTSTATVAPSQSPTFTPPPAGVELSGVQSAPAEGAEGGWWLFGLLLVAGVVLALVRRAHVENA